MKHVFVETNWVVEYAAPAHRRTAEASSLIERAAAGELRLYIPSISLSEARNPIRTKFHPRSAADTIRKYLGWATDDGSAKADEAVTVRRVLDRYEAAVTAELENLDERLRLMQSLPGVEVFALHEGMLARSVELSTQNLDLKPFDQAILAAVLVRSEELRDQGENDVSFCELDGDLQPWDKKGQVKQPLKALYDAAHVWVYGDFAMEKPARRVRFGEE